MSLSDTPSKQESSASMFELARTSLVIEICAALFAFAFLITSFDEVPSDWLHRHTMSIDPFLEVLTKLGDGLFLIPFCITTGIFLFIRKSTHHRVSWVALSAFAATGIVAQIMKLSLGRPRPYLAWDSRFPHVDFSKFSLFMLKSDFSSFPSGHASTLFAVAWVAVSLRVSFFVRLAIALFAILGSMSRVALAKHFIADVLAAAAIGIVVAQLVIEYYHYRTSKN